MEQAIRVVNAIEVVRHLLTQKSLCEGVVFIAAEVDGAAGLTVDRDNDAAGIRAIVRANCLNDC
jgi:hypothetical protein